MNASRQSDRVTWWKMGRTAVAKYGLREALELAATIKYEGVRRDFLDGVHHRPRPKVRRPID